MDDSEHYDPDHGDTHRHLNSPEPPLDPLSSWLPFQWPDESFPPSPPPVPNNEFGLPSYQTAVLVQEDVPSRYLHFPEPPLDPLWCWSSFPRQDESFSPFPPPVPNNVFGHTSYQTAALVQENVPSCYLRSPEPPLDPQSSRSPFPGQAESFSPSLPPVPHNDVGLISYQAAAPVQENVPSRTVDNTKSLIGESDLHPETDFGGSSRLTSGYVTGTEGRGGLTGSKKTGLAAQRERTKNMTREELEQYSNLPRERAARKLNLSVTTLKKLCRKHRIPRWPYKRPGQLK